MPSRSAMPLFDKPSATSSSTSISRAVSGSVNWSSLSERGRVGGGSKSVSGETSLSCRRHRIELRCYIDGDVKLFPQRLPLARRANEDHSHGVSIRMRRLAAARCQRARTVTATSCGTPPRSTRSASPRPTRSPIRRSNRSSGERVSVQRKQQVAHEQTRIGGRCPLFHANDQQGLVGTGRVSLL